MEIRVRCPHNEQVLFPEEEPHRAWYYDETDEGRIVREFGDPDDGSALVWLCDQCAEELDSDVFFASEDELNETPCWRCGR